MQVQVFGLQRSGTNYLHWLIDRNTEATATKEGGWKHAFPHERRLGNHGRQSIRLEVWDRCDRRGIRPVVVRKDFDHWRASLRRNGKDYDRGDHHTCWEKFHAAWEQHAPIVRYEDFLSGFEAAMDRLGQVLEVQVTGYVQPDRVPNSPKWRHAHRRRYV